MKKVWNEKQHQTNGYHEEDIGEDVIKQTAIETSITMDTTKPQN